MADSPWDGSIRPLAFMQKNIRITRNVGNVDVFSRGG